MKASGSIPTCRKNAGPALCLKQQVSKINVMRYSGIRCGLGIFNLEYY